MVQSKSYVGITRVIEHIKPNRMWYKIFVIFANDKKAVIQSNLVKQFFEYHTQEILPVVQILEY